ncbi:predicted protein [Naegleria gruberi]|uniref:Predicted protein n=1 Tax=Naegleria gruberi TaxID=5762 RepID=D2VEP9_NAEGR|nr:uncharacterized protein NAEGRDRAFT_48935 [Naegleria gruberi]EFC44639.1 predicted protein [Naegleria gruberi]|eukprot:XP_002677383.1 predicted protein [Naegleria gruberi strain NEG-M]
MQQQDNRMSLCRKLFNRSIDFRDQSKKNPHNYYASDAFHYKEILSESMIQSQLYSYNYNYHLKDKDNIVFAEKFFTTNYKKVYNDDGNLFHNISLDTKSTGKKKKNSEEILDDKICDVMVISNPSSSYWNQTICLTKSNYLYHFNSENSQVIKEDNMPLYLYLGSQKSEYSSVGLTKIRINHHYESIYFVSNLKDRSAIEITVLNFKKNSHSFGLKTKFLLKRNVFGRQLSTVSLQSSMMFLGYENDEIKIYNLDQFIQNFTTLLASDIDLVQDYYGMKKRIPITLDIDPNSLPLMTIDTSIPISYPLLAFSSAKPKCYKNYTSSNGIIQLNTNGFCKVILKSDFIYFDVSIPGAITTLQKLKENNKLRYELWAINQKKTENNRLCKINDPHDLIMFNEKLTGVAVSPELMVDRYERIIFIHPNFIRNISVNKRSNELVLNYEINIMSLVSRNRNNPSTERPKRAAKRVDSYFITELLAFDYDSETDLMCGLLSNGDIFLIRNSSGDIISKFNIADSIPKKVFKQIWNETPSFEITLFLCMDKIILEYQLENSKVFALCFKLEMTNNRE